MVSGEKPLNLQRDLLSLNYYFKSGAFPTGESFGILSNYVFSDLYAFKPRSSRPLGIRLKEVLTHPSLRDMEIFRCRPYRVPPWMVPDISPCVIDIRKSEHSSDDITSIFLNHLHTHDGTVATYTDGSKKDDSVGCAAIVGRSEYSASLSAAVSSFSAELIAILLVLKNIFLDKDMVILQFLLTQRVLWMR